MPDSGIVGLRIGQRKQYLSSEKRDGEAVFFFARKVKSWRGGHGMELGTNPLLVVPVSVPRGTTYRVTFSVSEAPNWVYTFDPQACVRVQ